MHAHTHDYFNFLIVYGDWSAVYLPFPYPRTNSLVLASFSSVTGFGGSTGKKRVIFETSNKGHVICKFDESQNGIVPRNVVCVDGKKNWRKNASLGDSSI